MDNRIRHNTLNTEKVRHFELDGSEIRIGPLPGDLVHALGLDQDVRVFVLVDENTARHCLPVFEQKLAGTDFHVMRIQPGEQAKRLDTCRKVWETLARCGADRQSVLFNLGGGVVTDLGGYVAASYMRGIRFFHFPTTLMGMADAAIGGKTGVNLGTLKNYIGAFIHPEMTWIDPVFLKTLPHQYIIEGFAEIIKHACIRDLQFFAYIEQLKGPDQIEWGSLLQRACKIKIDIVREDFKERGLRKILNFGHTIGHAIESASMDTRLPVRHGFAVAAGMKREAMLSRRKGLLPTDALRRIIDLVDHWFPRHTILPTNREDILRLTGMDKKREGSKRAFILLEGIGTARVSYDVTAEDIRAVLIDAN